ncbi:MAG: hypothetical protein KDE51_27880 [Anaerolineales bacterium]|nr:hypothetical protein [Anaerolineales bacterium]
MSTRLRFYPSVTNPFHIEALHTAVFSWGIARALKGEFVVCTADSAQTAEVIEALEWLGLDWDEGLDMGGEHEPYEQAERQALYRPFVEQLIAQSAAEKRADGAIYLQLPKHDDPMLVDDHGRVSPFFAAVCDDHLLGISHVVQEGTAFEDLPIVQHLYQQLGWEMPTWIYLPQLVLTENGQVTLEALQTAGYLPAALTNYLFLLGWTPPEGNEIFNPSAVKRQLRLEQLPHGEVVFNWAKLNGINRQYLSRLSDADLAEKIRPYLEDYYGRLPANEKWLTVLTHIIRPEMNKLEDAPELAVWALDEAFEMTLAAEEALASPAAKAVLTQMIAELAHIVLLDAPTAVSILKTMTTQLKQAHGWSEAQIQQPLQAALSGDIAGPALSEVMGLLGKARCLERLGAAVRAF